MESVGSLQLRELGGASRHYLLGRLVNGGDAIALCVSGGWIVGRFERDADDAAQPWFHFSIELNGGEREECSIVLPEHALLRWA